MFCFCHRHVLSEMRFYFYQKLGSCLWALISWNSDGSIPGISIFAQIQILRLRGIVEDIKLSAQAQPEINCLYFCFPEINPKGHAEEKPFFLGGESYLKARREIDWPSITWMAWHTCVPYHTMAHHRTHFIRNLIKSIFVRVCQGRVSPCVYDEHTHTPIDICWIYYIKRYIGGLSTWLSRRRPPRILEFECL